MSDPITRLNAALDGRYRVERQLGEGGMATVYLADDLRHERRVALKVLKPELAAVVGAERFLAEIKTTANLQHPHILPLYDSGEAGGFLFYMMPYVEGESLRERLDREHQLPVEEAVQITKNVAEALDYAHKHGVIHRDIKPANILLQAGKPVVSDFGIALAVTAGGGHRLTETGLSLGTPHYMSPEQATGDQHVGAATDIYALGCVLYEMLVGEPPYTGSTPQAILGKIIQADPVSVMQARRTVPAHVDAAVRRALERVPADRFADALAFAGAIGDAGFRHGAQSQTPWKRAVALLALVSVVLAIFGIWSALGGRGRDPILADPVTWTLAAPTSVTIDPNWGLAVSPDGRSVVFFDDGSRRLYLRDLGRLEAQPIPGTESSWKPFFSSDGAWIGFFDDTRNTLKRVRLDGTGLQVLASVPPSLRSGSWGTNGTIVFHSTGLGGMSRVADEGGEVEPAGRDAGLIAWIQLLPGGEAVLGHQTIEGVRHVVVVDLKTGRTTPLFPGISPRYVNAGYLVYGQGSDLWAVPFDPERPEHFGAATLIVQGVEGMVDRSFFDVSDDLLVYAPLSSAPSGTLPMWVDAQGNAEPLDVAPGQYAWPRLSPDGRKLAIIRTEQGNEDVWVVDLETTGTTQLTFDPGRDRAPVWTPDGERIVFASDRGGARNLFWVKADRSDEVERLTSSASDQRAYGWTPDGSLLFTQDGDVWSLDLESGADAVPLMQEAYREDIPAMSPDGRFIAVESEELGYPEIFVRSFPSLTGRWLVSTLDLAPISEIANADIRDGRSPVWGRDGREIYYQSGTAFVRVPVSTEGVFVPGTPEVMLDRDSPSPRDGPMYDVAPDGERLLILGYAPGEDRANELIVLQNWRTLLSGAAEN